MKQFLFRYINRLGNSLSYRHSRFILNNLGLGKVIGRFAGYGPNDYNGIIHADL